MPHARLPVLRIKKVICIHLDCNSENVVYLLSCRVCNLQYVGSTVTSFRLRFNNHKSRIATHSKASRAYKDMDDPLYKHFCSAGHQGVKDVEVTLIDRVNGNECDLREKEGQWAYRLKTLTPDGLNTNDSLYSLAFVLARANTVCFFARA